MKTHNLSISIQYIIIAVSIFFCSIVYGQIGNTIQNPSVLGTFSSDFKCATAYNTKYFTNTYTAGRPTNDVYTKFTLNSMMTVEISHCYSTLNDTYMSLLNSSGTLLLPVSDDDHYGESNCSNRLHAYMKRDLVAGTYYVVSEGWSQNGEIQINIFGTVIHGNTMQDPITVGTFGSSNFSYSNSQNTEIFSNAYTDERPTNDVYYKFTLSKPMTVEIKHCDSPLSDTYMSLLNSAGTLLPPAVDDYDKEGKCSSRLHSYTKRNLPAGTYYVVSEGWSQNGVITTSISGQPLTGNTRQNPIVAGTFGAAFQYTNTQNTANFSNDFTNRTPNDVFYKFTLTKKMSVAMTHCDSETGFDTYMHLLDASGNIITYNDDYYGDEACSSYTRHSFLYRAMNPGTYYIVSEGFNRNGTITTNIKGFDNEFDYPEAPNVYDQEPDIEPGAIAGSFAVSATGAATYTIPIEVPQGSGGMQPSLSIVYNSQSGNGVTGWGCNLSGISAITRAPKSIYYDGSAKGIIGSTDDEYVLDGQRLIHKSGTKGKEGAVYCTESDQLTKITMHGTESSSWFEIQTKDGAKYYYGYTFYSRRIHAFDGISKVDAWYLEHVQDVMDNYMTYSYVNYNRSLLLSSVVYGKHLNSSVTTTTEYKINFTYESRSDVTPFMVGADKGSLSHRLYKISIYTGTDLLREYVLGYTKSDHFSRLTSITEKNGAGKALKPTRLGWSYIPSISYGNGTVNIEKSLTNLSDQYYTSADMNGDGVSDIISLTPGYKSPSDNYIYTLSQHFISTRQSDGSYKYNAYNPRYLQPNIEIEKIHSQGLGGQIAFNAFGDGKEYLLIPFFLSDGYGPQIVFYIYGIEGLQKPPMPDGRYPVMLQASNELPLYTAGNVYNNGKDAIVFIEKGNKNNVYPGRIGQLSAINPVPLYTWVDFKPTLPSRPEKMFLSDFNGDGMNDVLIFYNGGYSIFWNQGGSVPYSNSKKITQTNIGNVTMIRMGDFNGDGLSDFIMNATDDNKWYFALNNGGGTFTKQLACTLDIYDHSFTGKDDGRFNCHVFDFDHDGKSDIVINKAMYRKRDQWFSNAWGEFTGTYTYWMRSTGSLLSQVSMASSSLEDDAANRSYTLGDFNGDGRTELIGFGYNCYDASNTVRTMRLYKNFSVTLATGMLTSITDGYGSATSVKYAPLTSDIYTKGSGSAYPVVDCALPFTAVKSVTLGNGAAGNIAVNYKYAGAKVHLTGKGFLGMTQTETNTTMGVTTESGIKSLNLIYFAPAETYTKTTIANAIAETSVKYTFANKGGKKYFMYPNKKTEKDFDGNTVNVTYKYDEEYGNITEEKTEWSSNMYRTVKYEDYIQAGGTMQNKPRLITEISKHADDEQEFTRKTSITYNTSKGYPTKKIENYGSSLPLTTEYTSYDNFGNLKSYKISGKDLKTVTYYMNYDPTNRFVAKMYSSPAHTVTTYTYDGFGNVLTEKDETGSANILTLTHTYNKWGRRTSSIAPDGTKTVYRTGWGSDNSASGSRYYTLVESAGQPWVKTWYDKKGREVVTETVGPKGMSIKASNTYNSKGLLTKTETKQGSLTLSTSYTYDGRGRMTQESGNGQTTTYAYGNRRAITIVAGKQYSKIYDAWGGIKQIVDHAGSVVYTYHSAGKPSKVSAGGAIFSMTYDDAGNQQTLKDPNAGTITYTYNAAAGVKTQVDGKGKKTEHFPDNLNRNSYTTIDGVRTDYTYGTSGYDMHWLKEVKTGNNTVNYTYDRYGRLETEKRKIDGGGQSDFEFKYNTKGQLETVVYPDNVQVKREYDAYGNLIKVSSGTQTVWELTGNTGLQTTATLGGTMTATSSYNSLGLLTGLKTVKGSTVLRNMTYSFNASTGNLGSRTGMITQTETFEYDALDRLNSVKHAETETMKINYKPNGNISNKTGLGDYRYHATKVHAVSGVDNTDGLISAEEQNITYTAFNKASKISEKVNNDAYELNIVYGPDQQRWKSELKKNGTVSKTTVYAGDYEKITENGVTRQLYYISGGDGPAAILVKQQGQSDKIYYLHRDHLGSVLSLTDNTGVTVFKANYDAWGKQTVTTNTFKFHRGFTGHEHLPEFALINMNGRMYDPILGRFLSPDPYVQAPEFSQSFNRYSYCVNNPLIYTDPDGEIAWFVPVIIGAVIGMYSGGVLANDGQFNPAKWDYSSGKTWGFMAGGTLIGGLSGGAAAGVSALGGGAWWAGAAAGTVGGAGFNGLATDWDGGTMFKGALIGGAAGFIGGSLASAIGGGWGAMAGGAGSNITSQLLYTGKVDWASVGVSALSSYGMYHAMSYATWKWGGGNNIGGRNISYRQFNAMNTAYQRSRFWRREFGVYLNNDGSAKITPWKDTNKYNVNFRSRQGNINQTMHAHWAKDGVDLGDENYTVGGYHSTPDKQNLPGLSLVVGRTSSTYFYQGTSNYNFISPDPFVRFFLFPW